MSFSAARPSIAISCSMIMVLPLSGLEARLDAPSRPNGRRGPGKGKPRSRVTRERYRSRMRVGHRNEWSSPLPCPPTVRRSPFLSPSLPRRRLRNGGEGEEVIGPAATPLRSSRAFLLAVFASDQRHEHRPQAELAGFRLAGQLAKVAAG